MNDDGDHRVDALPPITIRLGDYHHARVWPASRPIFDNGPDPDHGTEGYHLHCYSKTEWVEKNGVKERKKVVDDTYLAVFADCQTCGERTQVSENTTADGPAGVLGKNLHCVECRVIAAHKAKGCTHGIMEWCPLRGKDPFSNGAGGDAK